MRRISLSIDGATDTRCGTGLDDGFGKRCPRLHSEEGEWLCGAFNQVLDYNEDLKYPFRRPECLSMETAVVDGGPSGYDGPALATPPLGKLVILPHCSAVIPKVKTTR